MSDTSRAALPQAAPLQGTTVISSALWILLFAAATALGARVEIPHAPVPYTLQTLVVILAGAFLGARNGAISQIAYLAAGALGAPVFAHGGAGILTFVGPTGGYLAAFPLAAAVVGLLTAHRVSLLRSVLAMAAGLLVIFTLGTLHLYAFTLHNFSAAFTSGFLIFSWWDMVKLGAAAMTYYEVAKRWKRVG
jgi:biotin transport system substrate-specific component